MVSVSLLVRHLVTSAQAAVFSVGPTIAPTGSAPMPPRVVAPATSATAMQDTMAARAQVRCPWMCTLSPTLPSPACESRGVYCTGGSKNNVASGYYATGCRSDGTACTGFPARRGVTSSLPPQDTVHVRLPSTIVCLAIASV